MKYNICYLILCHKNPENVKKIIDFLYADDAFFAIHVDKKSNEDFTIIKEDNHVKFVRNRISTTWGNISVVDAVISLSMFAINTFKEAQHFCLISGADFPMKSHAYIKEFLSKKTSMDFIQGIMLPSERTQWLEGGRRRIEAYVLPLNAHRNATIEPRKLSVGNFRQIVKVVLTNFASLPKALMIWLTYPKRMVPSGIKMYGGEMWWMLSKSTLTKVLEWNVDNPDYYIYHQDSQVPDEMYFNTLVWNLSSNVKPDIMRYISWVSKQDPSPRWMSYKEDKSDVDKMIDNPNILFARKIEEPLLTRYITSKLESKK